MQTAQYRFAMAGIIHETNTYAEASFGQTTLSAFEQYQGQEIIDAFTGANHQIGGFIQGAKQHLVDLHPIYLGQATPSGTIAQSAYLEMKAKILNGVKASLPIDAMLLALHGAGVADGFEDIEGDLLASLRSLLGPEIPIAVVYDLHANCTPEMFANADISLPCKLYPHIDFADRAVEAVDLIVSMRQQQIQPVSAVRYLPILPYIVTTDQGFIPAEINAHCQRLLHDHPTIIDCSWFHGFPYADIAAPCPAVICTTNNDCALAEQIAEEIATLIWSQRERFLPQFFTPHDAIQIALEQQDLSKPIVINEYSDNPGGGTPGDGTYLLSAILNAPNRHKRICFGMINDAAVVQQAMKAGVGQQIDIQLGGKLGPMQGAPIVCQAYVKSITDGHFVNCDGAMFAGVHFDLGPMCRLVIAGVDVIVACRAEQVYDEIPFFMHGIDILQYDIVALKGANHFRARYNHLAAKIITANAVGLSSADILSFPRRHLKRAVWPKDAVSDLDEVYP